MINVTDATKSAYTGDSTHKTLTITFPDRNITFDNSDIASQSLNLVESIETENNLTFKGCIASQLKFTVAGIVTDLRGEYLEASIQADETEVIPLFKGYVDTQDNESQEDILTQFTCYDPLYKVGSKNMQTWVDGLTYPITVRNFRNSLFANLGITQESKTLINDGLTISENLKTFMNTPSATDLMKWICQLNAVYGQYGRDGKFHYRELNPLSSGTYPSETLYPSEETYPSAENAGTVIALSQYTGLTYEPYETERIRKVIIIDGGGLEQGQAGTSGNTYVIQDNPIAFNVNMRTAANAILAKIEYLTHIPIVNMNCVGMPYLECGDTYVTYTRRNICRTYIFQRTLSGIQALSDEYSSDCDKDFPPYKATAQTSINAERKSIIDIQADVANFKDITASNIEAINGKFTRLYAGNVQAEYIDCSNRIKVHTLDVGKITGSVASGNVANKGKDWSLNFQNGTFNIGEIDAQRITTGYLSADRIQAHAIGVGKLAGSLSATAQGCSNSWSLNFNNGSFSIGDINANSIKAGTIDSQRLSADVITTNNLSAQSIDGSQINAGTISANQIHAGTITADRMNVDLSGSGDDQSSWGLTLGQYGSSFSVGSIGSNRVNNSWVGGYYTQWQKIRVIGSIDHTYIWQNAQKTIRISDTQPDPSWTRVGEVAETVHGKTIYTIAQDNAG